MKKLFTMRTIATIVSNTLYAAIMGFFPVVAFVNWIALDIFISAPRSDAQLTGMQMVIECIMIMLFSLCALLVRYDFKTWLFSLPMHYVLGVAMGGLMHLVSCFVYSLLMRGFHFYISHPIHIFLRPLILLAVQTLILYLRHRRRLRREGEAKE